MMMMMIMMVMMAMIIMLVVLKPYDYDTGGLCYWGCRYYQGSGFDHRKAGMSIIVSACSL